MIMNAFRASSRTALTRLVGAALLGLSSFALAQAPMPRLEPLPEPPPPPPSVAVDSGDSPIRISPGAQDKVEDVVVDGQRGERVTTPQGGVYYVTPDPVGRIGTQAPGANLRVPQWVVKEF